MQATKRDMAYKIYKVLEIIFLVISFIFIVGGIAAGAAVLGYQVYTYLKDAVWVSYSINSALTSDPLSNFAVGIWASNPQSWLGLHKV